MLLRLRNTARRGRSLVPRTFRRIRSRIRPRASTLCLARSMLLACCLSGLPPNDFVRVLDALALVGIGLAEAADLGRNLSDFLLVDAGDGDVTGLGVDGDIDPFRNREADRMRVAELEHDLAPFDLGAIADADDVELALEAFAHALDVVRHERAHQAVERAGLSFFVSPLELHDVVFHVDRDAGDDRRGQASLRSLHETLLPSWRTSTPFGSAISFLPMRDIGLSLPNLAEHFAAHARLRGLIAGEHALRGGDERQSEAAENLGDLFLAAIDALSGTGDALDAVDDRLAVSRVLQVDAE